MSAASRLRKDADGTVLPRMSSPTKGTPPETNSLIEGKSHKHHLTNGGDFMANTGRDAMAEAAKRASTDRKTYVVTGATGYVGKAVVSQLEMLGHDVRPISRRAGIAIDDAVALNRAFAGAVGAYLMLPFDVAANDLHAREDEIGAKLAEAVTAAGISRVVLLSGTSAHLRCRSGSAMGAAMMEERLDQLAIPQLVHLRGSFFMENLLQCIPQIAETGIFAWAFATDRATPMIAAQDVGERAAELLAATDWNGPRVQELLGPRDYTFAEAVEILGESIGRPDVRYVQVPYEEARSGMIRAGMSPSFADAVMETARSFNGGETWAKEKRFLRNTTRTTLERFAREVFATTYKTVTAKRPNTSATRT